MLNTLNVTINKAYDLISGKLEAWLSTLIKMLPNFAVAVLIVLAFVVIAKLVKKGLRNFLPRVSDSKSLNSLVTTVVYVAIIGIGAFVALGVLNLDKTVTSLLAGAGIIGLALGFAFQDIAANFMAGIIMAVGKPIRVGDLIETNDIFGTVQKVNLRNTEIHNPQGQLLIMPNKMIYENPIKNYTTTGKRRVDLSCGVSYGDDLKKVKEITIKAIEKLDVVDKEQGVSFFFREFGDSSINYDIRYWVKASTKQADYLEALHQGVVAIQETYNDNDIMIPFPIRTLDFGIKGGEKLSTMLSDGKQKSMQAEKQNS